MSGPEWRRRGGAGLVALLVAGCGAAHKSSAQPTARQQVTEVLRSYLSAQTTGNGQAACALLTAGGQQQLTTFVMRQSKGLLSAPPTCQDAVGLIQALAGTKVLAALGHASIQHVEVGSRQATAEVVPGAGLPSEQVSLQKVGNAWKIAAVPGLGG